MTSSHVWLGGSQFINLKVSHRLPHHLFIVFSSFKLSCNYFFCCNFIKIINAEEIMLIRDNYSQFYFSRAAVCLHKPKLNAITIFNNFMKIAAYTWKISKAHHTTFKY